MSRISIVIPVFNEEESIEECYSQIVKVFREELPSDEYEIMFCDDGSSDRSANIIRRIADSDPHVGFVRNVRNYGVYRNSFNAMRHFTGDALIPMLPVDLQDPPQLIPEFVAKWRAGALVVAGSRYERDEGWFMKSARRGYYRLASALADFELPRFVGEFQLIDASIATKLIQIDDYYPYTRGLIASLSNSREVIEYKWQKRHAGRSKHNLRKLTEQAVNGIVSTSTAPLRLVTVFGVLCAFLGVCFGIIQVFAHFTFSRSVTTPGISTLIVLLCFFSALILLVLAVLSEYVAAIHAQVRGRWRVQELEARLPRH